jgi:hypothetical protein
MVKLLLVILGLTLSTLVVALPALKKWQEAARPYSLRWHIEKAVEDGTYKATIVGDFHEYGSADDPPEYVVSHATVVIAQPVASVTRTYNDSGIGTWYKFKVVETLSEGTPCTRRCPKPTPPEELLPVNEDEFLMGRAIGTLIIDGVELSMRNNPNIFPPYSEDKKYLLFVMKESNGVASLLVGPEAVFTVGDDGETLAPVGESRHRFKDFIIEKFDSSAGKLRQHLKAKES